MSEVVALTTEASPADNGQRHYMRPQKKTNLLLLPQCEQADARDLDDLEAHTGNITLGLTTTTEARDENLVVLVDKVKATVVLSTHDMIVSGCVCAISNTQNVRGRKQ